jgi:hypothetical protein
MRGGAVFAVAVVTGLAALAFGGCKSSATPTAGTSCVALASCCATGSASTLEMCTPIVSAGDNEQCGALLTTYQATGGCAVPLELDSGLPHFDATLPHDGNTITTPESGTDAGTAVGPSCPAPTTSPSADCQKCTTNCETSNGLADACDTYYACFCPCAVGDTGCQQACAPLEGDCMDVASEVASCVESDCKSLCTPDAGSGPTGACAQLEACCDKAVDAGVLGSRDASICAEFGQMSEATCAMDLADGGQFAGVCAK